MTKRRLNTDSDPSTGSTMSSRPPAIDGLEERVLAFAEQLGRIAGTVQARTAGLMDNDTLKRELARVRDGAADLLQQLTAAAPRATESRPVAGPAPGPGGLSQREPG